MVFWDNCLWRCLLDISTTPKSEDDAAKGAFLRTLLPVFQEPTHAIVTSPALFYDVAQDIRVGQFRRALQEFEQAGYVTMVQDVADWDALAFLRADMRSFLANNPRAFSGANKPSVGMGDSALVYCALMSQCHELWTYDRTLLAFSQTPAVRGLKIVPPYMPLVQPQLPL